MPCCLEAVTAAEELAADALAGAGRTAVVTQAALHLRLTTADYR